MKRRALFILLLLVALVGSAIVNVAVACVCAICEQRPLLETMERMMTVSALEPGLLWPGFAINTVFYAAILRVLFGLGGTPFALRRRRRIKRGLCPKCAYPVGTSEKCTECGAQLPSPSR